MRAKGNVSFVVIMLLAFTFHTCLLQLKEYKVVGRRIPTERDKSPTLYRMRVFATEEVSARSRFWYFMKKLKKIKKTAGEICYCGVVSGLVSSLGPSPLTSSPDQTINFGKWPGTHMRQNFPLLKMLSNFKARQK